MAISKRDKALKQLFKTGSASVSKISIHSNVRLIVETRSHKACSNALRVARILGFRVTHPAQRLTLFTAKDKPFQGYRFLARLENAEKMLENAQTILANSMNTDALIEVLS